MENETLEMKQMGNSILIDCGEMHVDGILKAAMINAITRIEKGAGRKERSDLRRFILECAKILEFSQIQNKNPETFQENMLQ